MVIWEQSVKRHRREQVTGVWRKLHTEEIHNLYNKCYESDHMKEEDMDRKYIMLGEEEKCIQNFSLKT
jgi:hypothetical protein